MKKTILVTGCAGFIGFHTIQKLLKEGHKVIGLDNINDYYDQELKRDRLKMLEKSTMFKFVYGDINDLDILEHVFETNKINQVLHLAAEAGVRHSIEKPHIFTKTNIVGFTNVLDTAKNYGVKDFVYASSSSVYGNNAKTPSSEEDAVGQPASIYGASKEANELIAYSYHHLFGMNVTGFRFFTVYGPYGRPDMALMLFADAMTEDRPLKLFNHGDLKRDFTYVDDIADGLVAGLDKAYPCEIFNLGNNKSVDIKYFIKLIEDNLGKEAKIEMYPMQDGDVKETLADISKAKDMLGYEPKTSVEEGIKNFVEWYKEYYKIV